MPWCKLEKIRFGMPDSGLRTADFDYELPPELIAQHPAKERDASRLLVLHRASGKIEHRSFSDLPEYLSSTDLLVLNNTRVFPARLTGTLSGGAAFEALLVRRLEGPRWLALVRPGRRLKPGKHLALGEGLELALEDFGAQEGERIISLSAPAGKDPLELVEKLGHVPLPPYIGRPDTAEDRERYQTVYARVSGAVAAPTAGLHFTPELLQKLEQAGIGRLEVTLHVGPGTFRPVTAENISGHRMDAEYYEIAEKTWTRIKEVKAGGGRVLAVGTTAVRALESAAADQPPRLAGWTELFITPGFTFRAADIMLTNFHLPRSTLLMLVSALAGKKLIDRAYREAVRERYRFYSYGDAMLIL